LPDYNEQAKVGNYFEKIEKLISNHQKQIEKLSKFKQSLSEKMFV
jgi:type I restriction enzyme S subunit